MSHATGLFPASTSTPERLDPPVSLGTNHHLIAAARLWHAAGWHPIPTTGKDGKTPALEGVTGYGGVDLEPEQFPTVFAMPGVVGLGLRMPEGVLGIDQDGYDGKIGPEAVAGLCGELGVELPEAPMISGRLDGRSGIRFYRVPPGLHWTAEGFNRHGGGVELIHRGHRHAKAWPSVHHRTGQTIGRVDLSAHPAELVEYLDADNQPWLLPQPDELPDLPPELVQALTERRAATSSREPLAWRNERGMDDEWSTSVRAAMGLWNGRTGSRYDAMRDTQARLVRLDSLGQAGATAALRKLHSEYVAAIGNERDANAEWTRALAGAMAMVAGTDSYLDQGRHLVRSVFGSRWGEAERVEPEGYGPISTNLSERFWSARPVLAHIRQAAHHRRRSADAVLGAVLARLGGIVPPAYRLPADIGAPSTLSFYTALVGPSGSGKSTSVSIARQLLPIPMVHLDKVAEHSLGSGEGLIELYMGDTDTGEVNRNGNTIKERGQVRYGAVVMLDEGQALTEMGGRKGSTMLPTLRTMWTGALTGQANAQRENTRKLREGTYVLGFVVGIQPALGADLLDDTAAGTPQRFLWMSTRDPTLPHRAERPPWPGLLTLRLPPTSRDGRSTPELVLDDEIADLIDWQAVESVRGNLVVDPMEGHRDLLRLKAAGLLALLDGRLNISMEDWKLATALADTSTEVRRSMESTLHDQHELKEAAADEREARRAKARASAEADQAEAVAQRHLEQAAATVARAARAKGAMTLGAARKAIRGPVRKVVEMEDVVAYAVERGWLTEAGGKVEAGPDAPTQ